MNNKIVKIEYNKIYFNYTDFLTATNLDNRLMPLKILMI